MRWLYKPVLVIFTILFTAGCIGGAPEAEVDIVKLGEELYTSKGCLACHSIDGSPGTGPTLKGAFGRTVKLATGETITADDAYLKESILDPDAKIVEGFQPGVMAAVVTPGFVTDEEADALVAYIKTLK
jgi:cytochrome c oxidase subunit 2